MLPRMRTDRNDLGGPVDVSAVPAIGPDVGLLNMRESDRPVWELALPYLRHRDNDVHTIYAYAMARALVDAHPDADPDVVLPGIILHDTGWSRVPIERILAALTPTTWSLSEESLATVRSHELEGVQIAYEILGQLDAEVRHAEEICTIIDGHDTRREALSLNDSLLKDADRLWRITPRGVDVVMDWFGLTREQSLALNASRVQGHLLTNTARTMARALCAIGWADVSGQRRAIDGVD